MNNDITKLVELGKIKKEQAEKLGELSPGTYCLNRSWGFGQIVSWDTMLGRMIINFKQKNGHSMDFSYATEMLTPLSNEHILVQRVTNLPELQRMAIHQPEQLLRIVLQSYGGKATSEQITNSLSGEVIHGEDWKKWWDNAKKVMKKDPNFAVPSKKSDPFILRAKPLSHEDELLSLFRSSPGLKQKIEYGEQLLKAAPQLSPEIRAELASSLKDGVEKIKDRNPSLALEAYWLIEELQKSEGTPRPSTEVVAQSRQILALAEGIPAAKQKRVFSNIKEVFPETWMLKVKELLQTSSPKLIGDAIDFVLSEQGEAELKPYLERQVRDQVASPTLLFWLAKNRGVSRYQALLLDIISIRLFAAILTAIEVESMSDNRKKSGLHDLISDDQMLIPDMISNADMEEVKDIAKALQLLPAFEELTKRSLLARIIKLYPFVQNLLTNTGGAREETLVVSWESLERRKAEYEKLVSKDIPANSKEIAIARSYGDLRENHEFKAAKEMQGLLMRRKGELELALARSRGTDFMTANTDVVSIGTRVELVDLQTQQRISYCILGAWDSDPDQGIISYQTPLAQALLNRKPGDEVELQMGADKHRFRVEAINPFAQKPVES